MALISGLFVSTAFDFRTNTIAQPTNAEAANNIWAAAPTLADGRDALVAFIVLLDGHVAVFSVAAALYVAASGHNADESFCEGMMSVLGVSFGIFFMFVFFPLVGLCFWQFFTDSTSPYPMLANVLAVFIFHHSVGGRMQQFFCEAIPLEVYHLPQWFLHILRAGSRGMGTTHLIAEAPLRAAAERRAAKLRAQMMLVDADGGTPSLPSPGKAMASPQDQELRTRRHLRVAAITS